MLTNPRPPGGGLAPSVRLSPRPQDIATTDTTVVRPIALSPPARGGASPDRHRRPRAPGPSSSLLSWCSHRRLICPSCPGVKPLKSQSRAALGAGAAEVPAGLGRRGWSDPGDEVAEDVLLPVGRVGRAAAGERQGERVADGGRPE